MDPEELPPKSEVPPAAAPNIVFPAVPKILPEVGLPKSPVEPVAALNKLVLFSGILVPVGVAENIICFFLIL